MRSRWLLAALVTSIVVLPLLVAAGPPPQSKGLRTVRLITFTQDAALVAGRARGYFAAEGIEVDITPTPNSTVQMRGIGEGTWDIASTAFDNVLAWSGREGAEIVAVSQTDAGIYLPIFVRPEIREWSDLRGRRLAADAVDTAFALVLRRVLLEQGLDLDRGDYELVAVGATGPRLESMRNSETFAGVLSSPWDVQAEAAGMRRIADHRGVLPDYPGGVYAVNRAWARVNSDTLERFLRAWGAGARWVAANRQAAIELYMADQGVGRDSATEKVDLLSADGALNLPGLASVLDLRTRFGFTLPLGADVLGFYDLTYYQRARGQ